MRNYFRQHFCPAPGGFTLVEMLVAVAMGAALIAAAATVFAMASQAIGTSKANTQVNSQLRVLYSWLQRDFERIRLDGYLVLNPQEDDLDDDGATPDERIDHFYFLISDDIHSMDVSDYRASLAIVSYGPDDTVEAGNLPLASPYDWVLTRRATLIVSDPTETANDVEQSSFAALLDPTDAAAPAIWAAAINKPDVNSELRSYLLGNIVSFKIVRYYMAGAAGPQALTPGTLYTFLPTDEKPAWIEFEIVMRDSNDRLEEPFTATYRVNLPSR